MHVMDEDVVARGDAQARPSPLAVQRLEELLSEQGTAALLKRHIAS